MKVIERNAQEIGRSLFISLPKVWVDAFGLKKGSKLKLVIEDSGELNILPQIDIKENKAGECIIIYDKFFERRFFRYYFGGVEKIIVKYKYFDERRKIDLYSFINRFMNVQIIEESENEITLKCFQISELSIEECLKRMFYISLNMLNDSENSIKIADIRDSMSRFYYMLIMQIRSFLLIGKFVQDNNISLVRAMDMRMVGEKVNKISNLLEKVSGYEFDDDLKQLFDNILNFYKDSFRGFIDDDYEKSEKLWERYIELKSRLEKCDASRIEHFKILQSIESITELSKEIMRLLR